jgi:hypothetical protein
MYRKCPVINRDYISAPTKTVKKEIDRLFELRIAARAIRDELALLLPDSRLLGQSRCYGITQ